MDRPDELESAPGSATGVVAPTVCDQQVLELVVDPGSPRSLIWPEELRTGLLRECVEMREVGLARRLVFACLHQALLCVLPHRLEHPVALTSRVERHQRLLGQPRQEVEHVGLVEISGSADCHRGVEGEAAREGCQPAEQHALAFLEQIVTPVDERAQRLLAWQCRAVATGQETEAV